MGGTISRWKRVVIRPIVRRNLDETERLPQPDRDRSLDEVIEDFGRCLRADGPDGEIDEWSIYDESFRRVVSWAEESGRFYEGLQALKEGGREHDVLFDPSTASWLKFTKPSKAGYVVSFEYGRPSLEPGLPLEYFERLKLQNEIFGDQVTFVGVGDRRTKPTIITRQADIPGEAADQSEIVEMMTRELGFRTLPARLSVGYRDSLGFIRDDVAVFDLRPANVVRTPAGLIVPIDSIPVRLDPQTITILSNF